MPNNILITPGSASIQFSGSAANTIRLQVEASGSVAFYGNSGSLFGISDSLSGSLMSVNDISGLPILEVFSDDRVVMGSFNRNTLVVTGSRIGIDKAVPTTDLDISGSVFITGSLRMSGGGITGSFLGTSSNAVSSSFSTTSSFSQTASFSVNSTNASTASLATTALTASSFTGYLTFPAGLDISGSLFVTGSETISGSLIVTQGITGSLFGTSSVATSASFSTTASFAQSSSVAVSSSFTTTASFASTAQTLLGSVTSASYAATASLLLGSVESASYALSASYAPGGSGLSGGTTNYIPVWTSATAQSSSIIYVSSSRNIIIGNTASKHPTNPPLLEINAGANETEGLHLHGQVNDIFQFNIKNYTTGTSASADIVAIADAGTPGSNNYISMGINSVAHADSSSVGNALDAYLFTTGSDLLIGNISPDKRIILFNGGLRADDNARVYIDATGSVGINTATPTVGNPEALIVRALTNSYNLVTAQANINNYSQINVVNLSGGNSASADVVATANNGNETTNFIDMGINSDQYAVTNVVGAANDAYIYSTGNNLLIGNATANKDMVLFVGGTNTTTNQKVLIAANNRHQLTGSLNVNGSVTSSLLGTSSWATNVISASFATTASFATSSSFAQLATTASHFAGYSSFSNGLNVSGSLVVTGSNITTGSVTATGTGSFSNLLPLTDNTGVVGSSALTWANGQFTNLTIDTALTVGDNIQLGAADQLRMGSATSFVVSHDGTNNYISSDESDLQIRDGATTRITLFRTTGAISASGGMTSSGFFGTSSWARNSVSSSFATTSSFVTTASFSVSASYAPGGGLTTKAGSIGNASFTGNPRKAPVNFTTPFANTNYAIVITGEDARSWTYEGKVVGGFTASANSNTALVGTTTWIATAYGET